MSDTSAYSHLTRFKPTTPRGIDPWGSDRAKSDGGDQFWKHLATGGAGDSICHNCDFFVTDLNPGSSRVPWGLLSLEKQKQKTFKPDLSSRARQVLLCIPFKEW